MGAYLRRDRKAIATRPRRGARATSRGCATGATSRRERCQAASSRCSRSRGAPRRGRGCCSSTSHRSGSRRSSSSSSSALVRRLNEEQGLTVLVVEQNANAALELSSRAYVLEVGRVALEGASAELREHEGIRKSYLGY